MNIKRKIIFLLSVCTIFSSLFGQTAISTWEELRSINNNLGGSYYLTNDIVLSDDEWIPLGAVSSTDALPSFFTGVFDGKGYKIKSMKITSQSNFKGLFGRMNHGTVRNLILEDVNMVGKEFVGAVAGAMIGESVVERVGVTGNIEGDSYVGGIVGRTSFDVTRVYHNHIKDCFVNAHIKTKNIQAGGIIGWGRGNVIIENVYVAGKLEAPFSSADNNVAGIVPFLETDFIQIKSAVVAVDEITGGTPNYFFCRNRYLEYSENVYVRNDLDLKYYAPDDRGKGSLFVNNDMLVPKENFLQRSFYEEMLGWDFENVWTIEEGSYPVLKSNPAPAVDKKPKLKIACIGNSITENPFPGYYNKYPVILQKLLGNERYAVRNYGASKYCLLKKADISYWDNDKYKMAKYWAPDVVVIKLGTNDTKDVNWVYKDEYESNYIEMINSFKTENPDVKIFVCYPIPAINREEKNERINELQPIIRNVAEKTNSVIIDLNTPFIGKPELYVDDLHPTDEGAELIAETIYEVLAEYLNLDETNTREIRDNLSVKIFPNPAENFINIQFTSNEKMQKINIFDISGGLAVTKECDKDSNGLQLDIQYFPAGVYIMNIQSSENKIYKYQFVKK